MNPGLVVKLRPAGPWRIGPDSGARNRVDVIYHSDSLYSAVTSAMSRMGMLEDWLTATARTETPAVCFSSCFPFLDEIVFVVPPRTIWPPTSPALMSARVRWKSARFVPLTVVQAILSGEKLNANQWGVDGASGCLVPNGRGGPFRTGVRWNAAVDRLSGASERHATACTEFRPGSGLWTIVGFADDAARDRWQDAVKAAFRLLADTGFGGERSRGWGRAETPEFVEGSLPELIIQERTKPVVKAVGKPVVEAAAVAEPEIAGEPSPVPPVQEPPEEVPPANEPGPEPLPETEPGPEPPAAEEPPGEEPEPDPNPEPSEPPVGEPEEALQDAVLEAEVRAPESIAEITVEPVAEEAAEIDSALPSEAETTAPDDAAEPEPVVEPVAVEEEPEPEAHELAALAAGRPSGPPLQAHWLLSLFTPAAADAVDWGRGSYTVLARGGRIDSPSGSGELKKQIQMVAEGSVLYADGAPRGSAADVAPDGFAHPVFRAGFALSIRLPEVH
uniref:CRISPR system Cms protein Csm4 n=1 Tax=Solibacter usitatus (strain Ellin6076) TaxID=234267 RepID=Q02AM3_SOLUE